MAEKAKVSQLTYSWLDGVLTVKSEELNRVERFDTREYPQSVHAKAKELGFKTKLANYATDAEGHAERLDAMVEGHASLIDGDWEREREKLPTWIKTKEARAIMDAVALLKGYTLSQVRGGFLKLGQAALTKAGQNSDVKAKMAELAQSVPVELDLENL